LSTVQGRKGSQTFSYTGSEQHFSVPSGVKRVTITATGASGAPGNGQIVIGW
jgi:hypothetical protein